MESTAAAKPQGDSGQPWSIPLLGLDVFVGTVVVHVVVSGVPTGEDRCQIGVVLSEVVQHGASGYVLKGRL